MSFRVIIDNKDAPNSERNEPQRHREHREGIDKLTKFGAASQRNGMTILDIRI
jgi:hypothetical protein